MSGEEENENGDSTPRVESATSLSLLGERIESSGALADFDVQRPPPLEGSSPRQNSVSSSKESRKIDGRPPRRPPPVLSQSNRSMTTGSIPSSPYQERAPGHKTVESSGDYSFLSALTEDEANVQQLDQRNRSVSWDHGVKGKAETAPPLSINTSYTPPSPPVHAPSSSPGTAKNASKWSVIKKHLNVRDIRDPMETAAEDAILRELEKNEMRDVASKSSNILPHVTEDQRDAFQPDPSRSGGDLTERTKEEASTAQSIRSAQSAEAPSSPHHRRKATLDDTLYDLATQLQRMHDEHESDPSKRKEVGRERLMTGDGTDGEEVPSGDVADALVKNAAVLFRRKSVRKQEASQRDFETEHNLGLKPNSGSLRWTVLSSRRLDPKKTDNGESESIRDGQGEDGDIETGVSMQTVSPDDSGDPTPSSSRWNWFRKKKPNANSPIAGAQRMLKRRKEDVKEDWGYLTLFLKPRTGAIRWYIKFYLLWIFFPAMLASVLLFYVGGKPTTNGVSTSWFILFLLRCTVTFSLAKATEVFIIDFLSLQLRWTVRIFGQMFTLALVQAKGYPFILFAWGLFNLCMNSGQHNFAQHWLFWQDALEIFNSNNPSGSITYSRFNYAINGVAMGLGVIVAVKRLWWGFYIGKRSYLHYGDELARVINNMLLISEVASLGKSIEKKTRTNQEFSISGRRMSNALRTFKMDHYSTDDSKDRLSTDDSKDKMSINPDDPKDDGSTLDDEAARHTLRNAKVIYEDEKDKLSGSLSKSQQIRMMELLGAWEEPETAARSQANVSIASILQFRQMLAFMDEAFPFSLAFGPADTREACVESAQNVYDRLILRTPDLVTLPFETIGVLAITDGNEVDHTRMKDLLRLFRPNRDGELSMIDFVKSCDTVYKNMRMLRASIANSGQVDRAFEALMNVVFWIIMFFLILAILGFDPMALFLSLSSIIVAFAFMVGSASAKYFEGILFIVARRPYDIGDRIAVADINSVASTDGSASWFVQGVDLYTTTVRYGATNEVATIANGSLASCRVINAKRSPKAMAFVYMRFGVNVPYHKVQLFRKTVEAFVKERPREWLSLDAIRATRVESEHGFVEYIIVLAHRESWQNIGVILQSKADVASYCNEVAKKLDMTYTAPPLPVDLSLRGKSQKQSTEDSTSDVPDIDMSGDAQASISPDIRAISALFSK